MHAIKVERTAGTLRIGQMQHAAGIHGQLRRVRIRDSGRGHHGWTECHAAVMRRRHANGGRLRFAYRPSQIIRAARSRCQRRRTRGHGLLPAIRCGAEKLSPPSDERENHSGPPYSVHAAYKVPSRPTARSKLPLCQTSLVSLPLPSPPFEFDRFKGGEKLTPPSIERANRISPPCDPPGVKMISCHIRNTRRASSGANDTRGSQEKVAGLRDTLTGCGSKSLPLSSMR